MRDFINQLVNDGWFTYSEPTGGEIGELLYVRMNPIGTGSVTDVRRDGRFLNPSRYLKMPQSYDVDDAAPWPATDNNPCGFNPALLDPSFPTASGYRILYPTSRLLRPTEIPDDAIKRMLSRGLAVLKSYLRERNANAAFHPSVIAASQPSTLRVSGRDMYLWGDHGTNPMTLGDFSSGRAIDIRPVRGWNPPPGNVDPNNADFSDNTADALWSESLRVRARVVRPRDGEDYSYGGRDLRPMAVADALGDFTALVMLCAALLEIGDYSSWSQGAMVDCYATMQAYNVLQRSAYQQVGQQYGTNVAALSEQLRVEAAARESRRRSAPAQALGSSYQSRGSDSADIMASVMAVASLAIAGAAAGGWVGAIIGLAIGAAIALISWLMGDGPTVDPLDRTLRSPGENGICFQGLSPREVLFGWPIIRIR
jgi:hypothetical protein